MNEHTEQVPASALQFEAECEFGQSNEGDRSSPFSMVARTGRPVAHAYWGSVVHDFSGMRTPGDRQRVAIDFNHDPGVVIGYANRFSAESGDLVAKGALTPTDHNNKATEIIDLARQGVPFQASISFGGGDGLKVERVAEGETVEVNGGEFSGPGSVIRQWTLTGIAVTPQGHDSNTSVEFQKNENVKVTIMSQDKNDTVEAPEAVDTELTQQETVVEARKAVDTTNGAFSAELAARLVEHFGEQQGSIYFAKGYTFEDALAADNKAMREEMAAMKSQMSAPTSDGEDSAAGPSTAPESGGKDDGDVENFSGLFQSALEGRT